MQQAYTSKIKELNQEFYLGKMQAFESTVYNIQNAIWESMYEEMQKENANWKYIDGMKEAMKVVRTVENKMRNSGYLTK